MTSIENPGHIGVIGAGVMGEALISALISAGVRPDAITVSEKREARAQELIDIYGVRVGALASNVVASDVLLLVVKPQDMESLLNEIKDLIGPEMLIISFAAGKSIGSISALIGSNIPIIRVMPNTPALVGEGMAAISVGAAASSEQSQFVRDFLSATGRVVEVDEALQDAVTAVSGSGPAYFFYFVESMISAGVELGLTEAIATELTIQTMVGAAKLLSTSDKTPSTLRENVTSPNGTTAAALAAFSQLDLPAIVLKAMTAARDRSQELA